LCSLNSNLSGWNPYLCGSIPIFQNEIHICVT
jgi:hypothetical protein